MATKTKKATDVKHPEVKVRLSGGDGNIFSIIGRVTKAMKTAGVEKAEVDAFTTEITSTGSYDEALQCVMRWVNVA